MRMELRQLAYFLAIAEERSFTRAAQRIPIAQPAISQQIHRLETELSEQLFVRDRRGIRLTPAGDALLPHARAMLADAEHAREAVAAVTGLHAGRLAVGFVQPLPDRRLIGLGRYDRLPPTVASRLVAREPVVAAVHPDHPLAGRGSITLHALRDAPMITLTTASKQRSNLEAACRAAGFAPRIIAETSDLGVTIELIQQQIGVAVLPRSALDGATTVTQLTVTRPKLDRRILLTWRPANNPPAARALLTLAHHHLAQPAATER